MKIGFLTGVMGNRPLVEVAVWAGNTGFECLEVAVGPGSAHYDARLVLTGGKQALESLLKDCGVSISSFAYYANLLDSDNSRRAANIEYLKDVIRASAEMGLPVVCCLAGFAVAGKDKWKTIEDDFADVIGPMVEFASSMGIKLAMENYFATLIQSLAHWDKVFEVVPNPNLGLNFDPSHLYWQGIDYLGAVDKYQDRIFHTHAKDSIIQDEVVRHKGILEGGWWRYVIPGYGGIDWPKYTHYLRAIGYDGVLSIEHEDSAFTPEEGLRKGLNYLKNWV